MKKLFFVSILYLLFSCEVQKLPADQLSNLKPVKLYDTTEDYLNRKAREVEAGVLVKNESHQHITINGFFDLKTGVEIKRGISAWSIEYNGFNYFNLGYCNYLINWQSFVKFDVEGKYCAIIIDEKSPGILNKTKGLYGSTLLSSDLVKINTNWRNKDNTRKKVLFVDTGIKVPQFVARNTGSLAYYLTRGQVEELLEIIDAKLVQGKIRDIDLEEVIEIIKMANRKEDM